MKHRSKKKGHTHGKHHKHKSSATTNTDAEAVQTTSPPSPSASAIASARPENMESRRSSMCEYCGAPSLMGEGYDDDTFDCADDCERFTNIDINDVTSSDAYQLRSPFLTAFFCQCSAVIGEIQSFVRNARTPNDGQPAFTESVILKIRPKLLDLFIVMWRLGVGRDRYASLSTSSPSPAPPLDSEDESDESTFPRGPTCPFVMVLSVLLPALHKFLQLTQLTKHHWWLGNSASFTMTAATELLTTQLQLHDLLGHVVAEGDRLALVIEDNEERDQDVTRLVPPQPLTPGRSGAYSSSSSSSSLTSSNSRPGSANDRDSGWSRLPQVKKISFEFEEWLAESKFELAELTEAIQENIEITALRLSRFPPLGVATDGTPKAKSPANEFVQSLMTNILVPLAERVVSTPSASRSYLFPRIVDRCICVAIDEYVVENGKWTAEKASYFEKAIELFRSWGTNIDAEFDKQLIKAPPNIARLNLLSMDAFRRLDILLHSWLRHGKDGETYIPRLTSRTNLENLRTTIKRTMTARGNGLNNPSGVSGLTTPSSQ